MLPFGISSRNVEERAEEGIPICIIHRITHTLAAWCRWKTPHGVSRKANVTEIFTSRSRGTQPSGKIAELWWKPVTLLKPNNQVFRKRMVWETGFFPAEHNHSLWTQRKGIFVTRVFTRITGIFATSREEDKNLWFLNVWNDPVSRVCFDFHNIVREIHFEL